MKGRLQPETGTASFVLHLHGHLPWVNHPEHEFFLEEDWFFEGVADCYLPILAFMDGWERDGIPGAFTMGISPPLLSMMKEPNLQERTARYLNARVSLARRYLSRIQADNEFREAAEDALARAERYLDQFESLGRDLTRGFLHHWHQGRVELITCGVTHGLHPVLLDEGGIRAQVQEAVRIHEKFLGQRPRGIWLPECGISPKSFELLAEAGIVFTYGEDRSILLASPPPAFGVHRPIYSPEGVALFARDPGAAKEVWSAEEGYPGDFRYREFYRDLGYDAPDDLLDAAHLQGTGARKQVGLKLHRITGKVDLDGKRAYSPREAEEAVRGHAEHFVSRRSEDARRLKEMLGVEPCITASFDAELFGHWWFEGTRFIDLVVRNLAERAKQDASTPRAVSALQYLQSCHTHQVAEPAVSSWGDGGAFKVWVNGQNDHIWRKIHDARLRLGQQADRLRAEDSGSLLGRALRQATREVLLASSSDWPFIITMGTQMGYAGKRTLVHLSRAHRLLEALEQGHVDENDLRQMESRDGILPDVNPGFFA